MSGSSSSPTLRIRTACIPVPTSILHRSYRLTTVRPVRPKTIARTVGHQRRAALASRGNSHSGCASITWLLGQDQESGTAAGPILLIFNSHSPLQLESWLLAPARGGVPA